MDIRLLTVASLLFAVSVQNGMVTSNYQLEEYKTLPCPSPCMCRWTAGMWSVSCTGRGLTQVPNGIPRETELLDLSCNRIQNISGEVFNNLQNLKKLNLSINFLPILPSDAFTGLIFLEELSIFRSDVQNLSAGTFMDLVNLKELRLFGNKIYVNISHDLFTGLDNLENLDLSDNRISTFSGNAFLDTKRLKYLDVSGNAIHDLTLGNFAGLDKLEKLDISQTNLESIPMGMFINLTHLNLLSLSGNELQNLEDGIFSGLSKLVKLDISQNKLQSISCGAFTGLNDLTELDLSYNNLNNTSTEHGALDLPKLKTLDLSANMYTTIPKSLPTNIKTLYLFYNKIGFLPNSSFESYPALEHLEMSNNGIEHIEAGTFDLLTNLKTAYFQSNKLTDESFPPRVFANNARLETVGVRFNMLQNVIEHLPSSITYLDYVGNQIKTIPSFAFLSTPNLQKMEFYQGQVQTIEDNAFTGLDKLLILDFMSDKITSTITKHTFEDLTGLNTLYFNMNNVSKIEPEAFKTLTSMTSLWIDWNYLSTLDANVLDIGNTSQLSEIYINNNPWNCDCHLRWLREKMDNASYVVKFPQLITCSEPIQLAGKSWDELQPDDFVCH